MEDGVSTVCVERAAIGERDGKLLEPVDEMIGVRNAAYVVGCEVVPYLEAPIPRHRRDLTIDETCSLRCDLLAEIFGDSTVPVSLSFVSVRMPKSSAGAVTQRRP